MLGSRHLTRGRLVALAAKCGAIVVELILAGFLFPGATDRPLETPAAEEILALHVDATGGAGAHERIRNRVSRGTFQIGEQGLRARITVYQEWPNKLYRVLESESLGRLEAGTDGKIVWERSPLTGPLLQRGTERERVLTDAAFDRLYRWREFYRGARNDGIELVDGLPCHAIVLTPPQGQPQSFFFDVESHLLAAVETAVETGAGRIRVRTRIDDYREVDGLLVAHRTRTRLMGQERVVRLGSVAHNVDLPRGRFDAPAEVIRLTLSN